MPKDCHDTALSHLEHRERSSFEVRSHLKSKGFQEEEIEEELENLKELHYIDDARYCESFVRYGMEKGRGPTRLQFELKDKGIDGDLIRQTIEDHFDRKSEKEAAMKAAKKILIGEMKPDEKVLAKIGRRLASLGYHTDIIYDILGQLRKSED